MLPFAARANVVSTAVNFSVQTSFVAGNPDCPAAALHYNA
jgi:hypothetical protein